MTFSSLVGQFDRLMSLRNPLQKMSKSEVNPQSRIELSDSNEDIEVKIKKAVSDSDPSITYDVKNRPGVSNLIDLHAAVTGLESDEIVEQSMFLNTAQYKQTVADAVIEAVSPIRDHILRLQKEPGYVTEVLDIGNKRAKEIAQETFSQVRSSIGLS